MGRMVNWSLVSNTRKFKSLPFLEFPSVLCISWAEFGWGCKNFSPPSGQEDFGHLTIFFLKEAEVGGREGGGDVQAQWERTAPC